MSTGSCITTLHNCNVLSCPVLNSHVCDVGTVDNPSITCTEKNILAVHWEVAICYFRGCRMLGYNVRL